MGYQPTFKLFHQLFYISKSNHLPLYELQFRAAEYGYNSGHSKPVIMQSSLKYWNGELIFLKGLDPGYMPNIVADCEIEDFHPPTLTGEALDQVFSFCECLGYQMTRDTFMTQKSVYKHSCKYSTFNWSRSFPLIYRICIRIVFSPSHFCFFFRSALL